MPLPKLNFDKTCQGCKLSNDNAICGCIEQGDLTNLKLVVISDYPGYYEDKYGYLMWDNQPDRDKKKNLEKGWPNAGNYIRRFLESEYNLDTYKEVYFTNAVKCKPGKDTPKEATNIKPCVNKWLLAELQLIEQTHPQVPILILGRIAYIAFQKYVPNSPFAGLKGGVKNARRQVFMYKDHPVVVSVNPAAVASSRFKLEFTTIDNLGDLRAVRELPPIVGSPEWHYAQDLKLLQI